jgi:cytochrome c biogenesis protein CcmG, thiol:disulfide interchange protein DsbE
VASNRVKVIVGVAAAAVLAAGLAVGLSRGGGSSDKLAANGPSLTGTTPAPKVTGTDLVTGAPIDLASYRGRPVFINAWASWCLPCRKEAPQILRFTKDHPEVVMLGVNMNDARANGRRFNADAGWTHPSIFDPNGAVGVDALKVAQLPATIYVDAKGVMRGRTQGPVTYDDLAGVAARLQAGK